jgi:3-isopropylmalate dehydrogenase
LRVSKSFRIAALAGDGIGPEVMREAIAVLRAVETKFSIPLEITEAAVGWAGIDANGHALSDQVLEICKSSDAILFGSVGLPDRDATVPKEQRPERAALLRLRKEFSLYANLRPVRLYPELVHACPLRPERIAKGVDVLVVRELTGGLYFGQPKQTIDLPDGQKRAVDSMVYSTHEVERIAHVAFRAARLRRKHVTSTDKANVLESGLLWREVVTEVAKQYPDVTLEHMLADNAAMQLILNPARFDVLLCENTFGDMLSDEAAALAGSLGMLPSASLGASTGASTTFGLYEPAGGTAPDIAGKGIANPLAQILSATLLLRYSLGLESAATAVEKAIEKVIASGMQTRDVCAPNNPSPVGTRQIGQAIVEAILAGH